MAKSILTNYRYYILIIIASIAMVGIAAVPTNEHGILAYTFILLASKLGSIAALWLFLRLYIFWKDRGEIPELSNLENEKD